MNILKQKGTLISLGFDEDEVEDLLVELKELNKFGEYMKIRYDLDTDKDVEDMYNLYAKTRSGELEDILMEKMNITDLDNEELILEATLDLTKTIMIDYAKIHEYKDIDKYLNSLDIYLNKILKNQLIQQFIQ